MTNPHGTDDLPKRIEAAITELSLKVESLRNEVREGRSAIDRRFDEMVSKMEMLFREKDEKSLPHFIYPSITFPTFDGDDPKGWIVNCVSYFHLCEIVEEHKVRLAAIHLSGKARNWYIEYQLGKGVILWEDFCRDLSSKFDFHGHEDIFIKFKNLYQRGTVDEYEDQFGALKVVVNERLPWLGEEFYISMFIGGLKPQLRPGVQMFFPESLERTKQLARFEEIKQNQNQNQRQKPQFGQQGAIKFRSNNYS